MQWLQFKSTRLEHFSINMGLVMELKSIFKVLRLLYGSLDEILQWVINHDTYVRIIVNCGPKLDQSRGN